MDPSVQVGGALTPREARDDGPSELGQFRMEVSSRSIVLGAGFRLNYLLQVTAFASASSDYVMHG